MPGPAASQPIIIPTRSEHSVSVDSTQVRPTSIIRFKDLPKAGPGTTRPPLPKTPSAALLEQIALYNQQISISSYMEAPTSKHPSSLASPIRLAPSYTTPHLVHGHGHPTPPSGQYHRQVSHSQYNPHCQPLPRPGAFPKLSPLSNHDSNSTFTPASGRPNPTLPFVRPIPMKLVGHTSNVTPARRPQVPGSSPPMVISPLKVMFDNASRGIHSELSYLQASCTALINRERKEKEMLRAHYFQMKRERDAARDKLKVLEQASSPTSPTAQPMKQETNASHLQIKSILKKRSRDEIEATASISSASSSSSSRSSSPPSPRTPSPVSELQHLYLPPIRDQSLELGYPDHTEIPHRVLSSPPPPPISARKMVFLSPRPTAPVTLLASRSSSVSPPACPTRTSPGFVHPTRKAYSGPPSPNPIQPSSPFLRPALSRVSRLNAPETELSPVDFAPSDESLPPAKRRRTANHTKEDVFSSELTGACVSYVTVTRSLDVKKEDMTEVGFGEGDMELENDSEGSEAGSEGEVAKSIVSNFSLTPPCPVAGIFNPAQPLRQMCSKYVRSFSSRPTS
ncbi:hypothetical protein E1B28_011660 [Marasmius oreades]|uniref:Uncharacterized protein n=1 Tax=Marasmius oreades TaxID=181124 RepID=A0A9P7RVA0_9AGAR|nr:uncharacterized protein E1B28_011660 [Marasmius oreades]KAG7090040.1 hypothetical protein E1B28_011660 [Marasmius oreades]